MASKKCYIYLKGLDIEKIDTKYKLNCKPNLMDNTTKLNNITPIGKLTATLDLDKYCFLDETKKNHDCIISTIKMNNLDKCSTCFWCRHSFETVPIGCPIKYEHSYVIKKFYSHITKNWYSSKENIFEEHIGEYLKQPDKYNVIKKGYYKTDGVFCSFNCCIAFIQNNQYNNLYNNSMQLLTQFYFTVYKQMMDLESANSWRLLYNYGGNQTIDEFRSNFKKISFVDHYIIENIPNINPIGYIFEKKINF